MARGYDQEEGRRRGKRRILRKAKERRGGMRTKGEWKEKEKEKG